MNARSQDDPMSRERDAKSKIESAALRLFAERGIAETSIREIAKAAGVSQGAMYNHYPSKEQLAWSLFSEGFSELGRELRRIAQEQPGLEGKLAAMIAHVFRRFDDNWLTVSFVFFARHNYLKRVTGGMANPYMVFRGAIADGMRRGEIPRGNLELAASMVTGAIIQVIDTRILGRLTGDLVACAAPVAAGCMRLLGQRRAP
jgi:AcrR family transcriptional regulator